MTRQSGGKGKKNANTSSRSSSVVDDAQRKLSFGKNSEAKIISQLKLLALDPCRPQLARDYTQALWNQILNIRKVMVLKDSEAPWRKRKLDQFIKDKLRPPSPGIVSPKDPKIKKLSRKKKSSHASSVSCLLNSADSTQCQDEKITFSSRASSSLLTFDDDSNFMHLTIDSEESVKDSNQLSPELNLNMETSNEVQCLKSQTWNRRHSRFRKTARRSIGDHLQRMVVPVGPRFQADVPNWAGPDDSSFLIRPYSDPDNSKWLGSLAWPIQTENTKTSRKIIGKGRPVSCSCVSLGSVDCIRRHVLEERLVLQNDLGPAFFSWKFNEMGDQISKVWSLEEQQSFESVVRVRTSANAKSFLKRVLKCLPGKKGKDVVNYYFNVYIPNCMSMHTRLPSMVRQVDTDNDEEDTKEFNYMGLQKKPGGRGCRSRCSKDVKGKYLRRIS